MVKRCSASALLVLLFLFVQPIQILRAADSAAGNPDPLIQLLASKGILTDAEAVSLRQTAPAQQHDRLLAILRDKGVISADEFSALAPASAQVSPELIASTTPMLPAVEAPKTLTQPAKPEAPKFIPAIAPVRVLQLEPSQPTGFIPDIKLGSGAGLKLYGMFKASLIRDSSSPMGTDMPLPGFFSDTGPGTGAEFRAKARSARIGASFGWPDLSPKMALTGKLEVDFEGDYTRVLNRNISSIRSSQPSIRLGYVRLDRLISDRSSVFALFGQDWTPFGSSTLPNLFETTGLGLGYGTLYERAPQARFGYGYNFGGAYNVRVQPEVALVLPAYGNTPSDLSNQLGMGERQGADSGRPEVQGRIVTQWQLDHAKGVVPAQFIVSFVQGDRMAMVRAQDVPAAFKAAFPRGTDITSNRWGVSTELQVPTRWFTLSAKAFSGADLRFYFVGELYSNFNDVGLLSCTIAVPCATASSIDGSSTVVFGHDSAGNPIVAPQRPIRARGFFVNLGLPLSRLAKANPEGRNAGWTFYLHYSFDEAVASDVRSLYAAAKLQGQTGSTLWGNTRNKSDLAAATLYYKMNNLVSFGFEQSYYRTRSTEGLPLPLWEGRDARSWHDLRFESGPIFTF
jgi:hypothetical protein